MKKYRKKKKMYTDAILTKLICDVCGKKFKVNDPLIEEEEALEMHEFTQIRFTGGFGSVFGDMDSYECDICQDCLKKKLGKFLRKISD